MSFALLRRTVAAGRVQANSSLVRLVSPVRTKMGDEILEKLKKESPYPAGMEKFDLHIVLNNGATVKSYTTNPLRPVWRPAMDITNHPYWQQQWQPEQAETIAARSEEKKDEELSQQQREVIERVLKSAPKRKLI